MEAEWKKINSNILFQPTSNYSSYECEIKVYSKFEYPYEFYKLFVTYELIKNLCYFTNEYDDEKKRNMG